MSVNHTHGQDDWIINEVFPTELANGYRGFFVEAGASDGGAGSNTYVLERDHGWSGLLIEPNIKFYSKLISLRKCEHRNLILSDKQGDIDFLQAGWYGIAPSLVKHRFNEHDITHHETLKFDVDGQPAETVKLPARTIGSILEEIEAPRIIDYFSLDVEGSELAVLNGFPFDRYQIKALTIETKRLSEDGTLIDQIHRGQCHDLLESRGYRLVKEIFADDCYVFVGKQKLPWFWHGWRAFRRTAAQS